VGGDVGDGWLRIELGPAVVLFGDRTGGVSLPPFDTANAGYLVGDDRAHVAENRRRLGAALGGAAADPHRWTRLRQVHGTRVLDPDDARRARWSEVTEPVSADGAVTTDDDVALLVVTADCAPVALAADQAVALVHAGWRGTYHGVLAAAVDALRRVDAAPIRAVIGPLARPCCYEFGSGDLDGIAARLGDGVRATTNHGATALDQPAAISAAAMAAGWSSAVAPWLVVARTPSPRRAAMPSRSPEPNS